MREYRQTLIEPCRLVYQVQDLPTPAVHIVIVAALKGQDQHNHYRQMLVTLGVRPTRGCARREPSLTRWRRRRVAVQHALQCAPVR